MAGAERGAVPITSSHVGPVTTAAMLAEFHAALPDPNSRSAALRKTLHIEEHDELIEALDDGYPADIARELADVVYVAYGTAFSLGIDLDAALREVHRACMDKAHAGCRREDGKIIKPPGFIPPDMTEAVRGACRRGCGRPLDESCVQTGTTPGGTWEFTCGHLIGK